MNHKRIRAFLWVVITVGCAFAQQTLHYNMGQVPVGVSVPGKILLKNDNTVTQLGQVVTSCGCTSAVLSKKDLAPLETTHLEYTFYSDKEGEFQTDIQVLSTTGAPVYLISIAATVSRFVDVIPRLLDLGSLPRSKQADFTIEITGVKDELKSVIVPQQKGLVSASATKHGLNGFIIKGKIAPSQIKARSLDVDVHARDYHYALKVPISFVLLDTMEVYPSKLFISQGSVDQGTTKTITIYGVNKPSDVTLDSEYLSVNAKRQFDIKTSTMQLHIWFPPEVFNVKAFRLKVRNNHNEVVIPVQKLPI